MECEYCHKKIKNRSTKYIETQEFHETITRSDYELSGQGCSLIRVMDCGALSEDFQVGNAFYCNVDCLCNDIKKHLENE